MLQKSMTLATALGLLAVAGCGSPKAATGSDFTSTECKFKASFPGPPKSEEQTLRGKNIKWFVLETNSKLCGISVSDSPVPAGAPDATVQAWLDGARAVAIRDAKGKQQSTNPITLANKYPGREFITTVDKPADGLLRSRIYVVGAKVYTVTVMGMDGYVFGSEANAFLDSFQLLE